MTETWRHSHGNGFTKKLVQGTQKHRTVFTSASVVSSDFSGTVVLEALDPDVLE